MEDVLAAFHLQRRHTVSFWDGMILRGAAALGCRVLWSITQVLEACEFLRRNERKRQSFSQVVREHFGRRKTSNDFRRLLEEVTVSQETLDAIEYRIELRSRSPAEPVSYSPGSPPWH